MRRLVAALVVASIALTLSACGGGSTPPAASAPPAAAPAAAAPAPTPVANVRPGDATPAAVTTVSPDNKLSPNEPGVNAPFPAGQNRPAAVTGHLSKHEPMLLFFFDPNQSATEDQRQQIDGALAQYRGLIEFMEFDVTGALPDPVTNQPRKDALGEQVALLVQDLKIGYTPYVILVDRRGIVSARYRGFIDQALLEREILRATQ